MLSDLWHHKSLLFRAVNAVIGEPGRFPLKQKSLLPEGGLGPQFPHREDVGTARGKCRRPKRCVPLCRAEGRLSLNPGLPETDGAVGMDIRKLRKGRLYFCPDKRLIV